MSDTSKREDFRIINPHEGAASLAVHAEDGRVLLSIHQDGTVTGAVEDASEAGARFVAYLRAHMFEQAYTASDDERKDLEREIRIPIKWDASGRVLAWNMGVLDASEIADAILASGFRRTAVQEPSAALAAIERAKVYLTDASETSEMRNRNAYGALKDIAAEPQVMLRHPDGMPKTNDEIRAEAERIRSGAEPQGEPSDAITDEMVERGLKVSREFPMKRGLDNARNVMRAVLEAALRGS